MGPGASRTTRKFLSTPSARRGDGLSAGISSSQFGFLSTPSARGRLSTKRIFSPPL